jgi:hypothetical protein
MSIYKGNMDLTKRKVAIRRRRFRRRFRSKSGEIGEKSPNAGNWSIGSANGQQLFGGI